MGIEEEEKWRRKKKIKKWVGNRRGSNIRKMFRKNRKRKMGKGRVKRENRRSKRRKRCREEEN